MKEIALIILMLTKCLTLCEQRIASEEDYSLSPFEPNHCGTAVQKSLEAGGLKVSEKKQSLSGFSFYYVRPYLPSSAYQVIKNNNPNGYEIYKKK